MITNTLLLLQNIIHSNAIADHFPLLWRTSNRNCTKEESKC